MGTTPSSTTNTSLAFQGRSLAEVEPRFADNTYMIVNAASGKCLEYTRTINSNGINVEPAPATLAVPRVKHSDDHDPRQQHFTIQLFEEVHKDNKTVKQGSAPGAFVIRPEFDPAMTLFIKTSTGGGNVTGNERDIDFVNSSILLNAATFLTTTTAWKIVHCPNGVRYLGYIITPFDDPDKHNDRVLTTWHGRVSDGSPLVDESSDTNTLRLSPLPVGASRDARIAEGYAWYLVPVQLFTGQDPSGHPIVQQQVPSVGDIFHIINGNPQQHHMALMRQQDKGGLLFLHQRGQVISQQLGTLDQRFVIHKFMDATDSSAALGVPTDMRHLVGPLFWLHVQIGDGASSSSCAVRAKPTRKAAATGSPQTTTVAELRCWHPEHAPPPGEDPGKDLEILFGLEPPHHSARTAPGTFFLSVYSMNTDVQFLGVVGVTNELPPGTSKAVVVRVPFEKRSEMSPTTILEGGVNPLCVNLSVVAVNRMSPSLRKQSCSAPPEQPQQLVQLETLFRRRCFFYGIEDDEEDSKKRLRMHSRSESNETAAAVRYERCRLDNSICAIIPRLAPQRELRITALNPASSKSELHSTEFMCVAPRNASATTTTGNADNNSNVQKSSIAVIKMLAGEYVHLRSLRATDNKNSNASTAVDGNETFTDTERRLSFAVHTRGMQQNGSSFHSTVVAHFLSRVNDSENPEHGYTIGKATDDYEQSDPALRKFPPLFAIVDKARGAVLTVTQEFGESVAAYRHLLDSNFNGSNNSSNNNNNNPLEEVPMALPLQTAGVLDEHNPAQHFSFAVVGRGIESPSSSSSDDAVDELHRIRRDLLSHCEAAHVVSKRDEIMSKREAVSATTMAVQKHFARLMRSAIAGIFVTNSSNTSNNSNNTCDVKCGSLSPAAAAFSAAQVVVQASSALSHDETEESDTARNAVVHLLLSKAFKKPVEEVARQLTIDAVIQACAMTSVDKECYSRLFDSFVRETPAMCVFFARGGGILAMPTPLLEVVVDFAAAAELKSLVFELCSAWGATAGMQQRTAAAPAMRAALCGLAWKCLCRRFGMELLKEQQQEQEQQREQQGSPSARLTLIRLMVLDAVETLKQLAFQAISSDAQVLLQQGLHDTRSRSASEVVLEAQLILNTQGDHYLRAILSAATGCSLLLEPIDASDSGSDDGNNGNNEALAKDSLYSVRDTWSGFFAEDRNYAPDRKFLCPPPVTTVPAMYRFIKEKQSSSSNNDADKNYLDNWRVMLEKFGSFFNTDESVGRNLWRLLVSTPAAHNVGFTVLVRDETQLEFVEKDDEQGAAGAAEMMMVLKRIHFP